MSNDTSQPNRIDLLLSAHSWLTDEQARLILCYKYKTFSELYAPIGADVQSLLDNFTVIACKSDEHYLRNTLALAQEHVGVIHTQRDWTLPKR